MTRAGDASRVALRGWVQFDLRGERPRARRWPRAGSSLAFPKTFGRGMRLGVRAAGSARPVGPSGLCGLNPVSGIDRPCGAICGASRRARRGRFQTPASRSLPGVSEASASPSVRAAHAPSVAPQGRSHPDTGFSPHRPKGPTVRAEPAASNASSTSATARPQHPRRDHHARWRETPETLGGGTPEALILSPCVHGLQRVLRPQSESSRRTPRGFILPRA